MTEAKLELGEREFAEKCDRRRKARYAASSREIIHYALKAVALNNW